MKRVAHFFYQKCNFFNKKFTNVLHISEKCSIFVAISHILKYIIAIMKKICTLLFCAIISTGSIFAEGGTCGENLTWDLTAGTLTISGTGAMGTRQITNRH